MPEHVMRPAAADWPAQVSVWATADVPGFHHWPQAPDRRAYLRQPHRHLFGLRAEVAVGHDERQVEIHDLQDLMLQWWRHTYAVCNRFGPSTTVARDCGPASCEAMARLMGRWLSNHAMAVVETRVSEDGQCGATVRWQ